VAVRNFVSAVQTFTHGGLFEGIGGFSYAFEAAGFQTVWAVENNPFCQQVLAVRFPQARLYGDIFDCADLPYVDVLTAGFPCTPFSVAGKGLGDRDARYLAPEMMRVIEEVYPRVILFENVPRFTTLDSGRYFKWLLQQLADLRYDAEWCYLRASDAGAPHLRKRWFCVAVRTSFGRADVVYAGGERQRQPETGNAASDEERHDTSRQQGRPAVLHAPESGREVLEYTSRAGTKTAEQPGQRSGTVETGNAHADAVGNTHSVGVEGRRQSGQSVAFVGQQEAAAESTGGANSSGRYLPQSRLDRAADGLSARLDGHHFPAGQGEYQYPFEPSRTCASSLPHRAHRIQALGNAVVPQVAYPIALSIREWLEANT